MAVDKQEFAVGTVFTGRYKKATYRLTVVETAEGNRYQLQDGQAFKSLSAAGSRLMGGKAVDGWCFWSLEGEAAATASAAVAEMPVAKANGKPVLHVTEQQGASPPASAAGGATPAPTASPSPPA